ncbi:MAG TPA: LuxR C-terminal-related transcriptional regulator [Gemmatimonadota bacterium]|nr:LuxR C-terminal-related transcriptional regulator [Gemmatimonadota bacterium]
MADRHKIEASPLLSLLEPREDEFITATVRKLGAPLVVVRTREEFDRQAEHHATVVIGDHQTQSERVSTVRRTRRHAASAVVAAISDDLAMTVELLEAGAQAVGSVAHGPETFARRIAAAQNGEVQLHQDEAAAVVNRLQHLSQLCVDQGVDVGRCKRLTAREAEIAALLAQRFDNARIAHELGIAVGTVKTHVHKILDKLDVETRALAGTYWRVYTEKKGLRR